MDILELKHTITEVRGSADGLKTKWGQRKHELSIKVTENIQSEQQRENRLKMYCYRPHGPFGLSRKKKRKKSNFHVTGVSEGEKTGQG